MSLKLPDPIARYFEADKHADAALLTDSFTADAVVIDEGNTYAGREAIRRWMVNASAQYTYTVRPFDMAEDKGRIVVASRLDGNFPGSPVNLRYLFTIDGDRIAALEIAP